VLRVKTVFVFKKEKAAPSFIEMKERSEVQKKKKNLSKAIKLRCLKNIYTNPNFHIKGNVDV